MTTKQIKHLQSKKILNINDLLSCIREVETVDFVLGQLEDCNEIVKISVENLAAQIEAV